MSKKMLFLRTEGLPNGGEMAFFLYETILKDFLHILVSRN